VSEELNNVNDRLVRALMSMIAVNTKLVAADMARPSPTVSAMDVLVVKAAAELVNEVHAASKPVV
jgi:hypothetical protein